MAIVNLTDDSYFADSRCNGVDAALERIGVLLDEGADIIDIGACSTRPGSIPVGEDEEWRRLEPVLAAVKAKWPGVKLSVDTYWASVVSKAYDLIGEFIVNDVTAGAGDPLMLDTVARLGLTYVAMHMRGTAETMQSMTDYDDITSDILDYFSDFARKAESLGIKSWILDPGFGFAKTTDQNYELFRNLAEFRRFSCPLLVGVSRKSMIYKKLSITPEESLPATQVLHVLALAKGADILRVHDVAEALRTVELYRLM